MAATRSTVSCVIFGSPCELPVNMLPTYENTMKFYNLVKLQMKEELNGKDPSHFEISSKVTSHIELLWRDASLPTVSRDRVRTMLKNYHQKYRNILKSYRTRKDNTNYKIKLAVFKQEANKLFDICTCKCKGNACHCPKRRKVPPKEIEFLNDQRSSRKMIIGKVDQAETAVLQKRQKRNKSQKRQFSSTSRSVESLHSGFEIESSSDSDVDISHGVDEWKKETKTPKANKQMRLSLPTVATACDRHGLSDRAASSLATAVLQDMGIVSQGNKSQVIDRSKVRRERQKKRKRLTNGNSRPTTFPGLYFDGRKDRTMVQEKMADGKQHRKIISEEHISIVFEPGSSYFTHVSPNNGTSKSIAKEILDALKSKSIDLEKIQAIGCDGTAVNTGVKKGVIRILETTLERPLQWLVCQLHTNELLLRHLFLHVDGATLGPQAFSGPIGKSLATCHTLPVCHYEKIDGELPMVDVQDLSTDQKYLHEICSAVINGLCPQDLSLRNPGALNHSRWLTTGNRILRLYIGSEKPSHELTTLTKFVIRVYAPMWFNIKCKPSCENGARHLFQTIQKSRYLPENLCSVLNSVIQRNGYFGHVENLLLSMITDERPRIRELGLRRILKARRYKRTSIRTFKVPTLNLSADDYIDLIDWQSNEAISEPPVTSEISENDLMKYINEKETPSITFPRLPCHTQAVERCVKMVTEASTAVCGAERRDGYIKVQMASRGTVPFFNTKRDYVL